jgi:hypothetical protein
VSAREGEGAGRIERIEDEVEDIGGRRSGIVEGRVACVCLLFAAHLANGIG